MASVGRLSLAVAALVCLYAGGIEARSATHQDAKLPPVILVPGDGGSQFEARINKTEVPHYLCKKVTDYWFSLWLNLERMLPRALDCTVDNMRLIYDRKTHTTRNAGGVEIRVPGFGNTSSVEWLDPSQFSMTAYYNPMVEMLVKLGYKRGVNIRGAPYDFRKAPNEMQDYLHQVVHLIEETYEMNDKTRVLIIAHSMGNLYTLYLLNHQPQSWKDKYIQGYFSMAGPWGGAAKTLRLMASGDNLDVFVVNPLAARPEQRSMPSTAWMLPFDNFWGKDEILVYAPSYNYTVNDYQKFLTDVNFTTGWYMRQDTENLIKALTPPGVETYCLHGTNVSTPAAFKYSASQWYDYQPTVITSDGDGTVNMRSLLGCLRWQSHQKAEVHHKTFKGVGHMTILSDANVIAYVKETIQGIAERSPNQIY